MEIKQTKEERSYAIKLMVEDEREVVGRAYLYVVFNDLHEEPYGIMEDVFVEESHRGKGIGKKLVKQLIEIAKEKGCYKLIGQSRYGKEKVHKMYLALGFFDHGKNFRMTF